MKELHELLILAGMFAAMFTVTWLLDRHFKRPDDIDIYMLTDGHGHSVKITFNKQATAEEREQILSEKFRELQQQADESK